MGVPDSITLRRVLSASNMVDVLFVADFSRCPISGVRRVLESKINRTFVCYDKANRRANLLLCMSRRMGRLGSLAIREVCTANRSCFNDWTIRCHNIIAHIKPRSRSYPIRRTWSRFLVCVTLVVVHICDPLENERVHELLNGTLPLFPSYDA